VETGTAKQITYFHALDMQLDWEMFGGFHIWHSKTEEVCKCVEVLRFKFVLEDFPVI